MDPADLRALADRLEQEAQTKAEEAEAERLQKALDAGQDALADKIAERLFAKMSAAEQEAAREAIEEEREEREAAEEAPDDETAAEEAEAGGETDLEGRWRPVRVPVGAKVYTGPAEPETVRYRDENGHVQSRPGRKPGQPYAVDWEQLADEPGEEEAAAAEAS